MRRRGSRLVVGSVVAVLTLSVVSGPSVGMEHLERRRSDLDQRIGRADQQLDQSSSRLLQAVKAVQRSRDALNSERREVQRASAALQRARELGRQAQQALDLARVAEAEGRRRLEAAQRETGRELDDWRRTMVSAAQGTPPSLLALASVFGSGAPEDLTRQAGVATAAVEAEAVTLSQLEATRLVLEVESARHQAAVRALRAREEEASSLVEQRDRLIEEARAAKIDQALALVRLTTRREGAARQRTRDLAQVAELKRERARIAKIMQRRAARANARSSDSAITSKRDDSTVGGLVRWPVVGYVSSAFGMRFHPVYKRWSLHDGLDIAAPCGTPVRAATSGEVVASYYNSAYGNRVILDNGLLQNVGVGTTYNHMSSFTVGAGERVSQGQVIGYVGTTGASTGCHLHFMVLENGNPVDPESWLRTPGF